MNLSLPTYSDIVDAETRIRPVAVQTPLLSNAHLDEITGAKVLIKAECLQTTGSFKIRGAMNRLAQIPTAKRAAGVVAFSSGNHAQGIARAAKLLDMPALIVMPSDAPQVKVDGVIADDGEIKYYDRTTESREDIAAAEAQRRGAILVPSFNDPHIIAGQGTTGLEIARQASAIGVKIDDLICNVGGGGVLSGIALALETASSDTKIWGVEPDGHDDWKRSLAADKIVSNAPGTRSICDALLTNAPGPFTWAIGSRLFAGINTVSDEAVSDAMKFAFQHLKLIVEPGGAAALAYVLASLPPEMRGRTLCVVLTGSNVDAGSFASAIYAS